MGTLGGKGLNDFNCNLISLDDVASAKYISPDDAKRAVLR